MTVYDFLIKCFTENIDNLVSFIDALSNSGEYTCSYCQIYYEWLKLPDKDLYNYCRAKCKKGVKKWLKSNSKEYIDEIAEEIDWSDENDKPRKNKANEFGRVGGRVVFSQFWALSRLQQKKC